MTKEQLIEKLCECKAQLENSYCDLDSVISDVISDICDYGDHELDSYTYYYDTIDLVEESIRHTIDTCGLLTLKNILSEIDGDYEYYHIDDVDGTIYPRDYNDVEEWIDDILSELGYEEDETTD